MDPAVNGTENSLGRFIFRMKMATVGMRDRYRKEYSDNPVFTLFLTLLLTVLVISVIGAIFTGAESIYIILSPSRGSSFMDYFDSVVYSSDGPYTKWGVIYPPLATIFYATIGHFTIPFVNVSPGENLFYALRDSQMGILSYFFITLLTFYVLHQIYSKLMKDMDVRKELMFILLILLSLPFIFAVQRGNSIILTLVFCLLFLMFYKSENRLIRYGSYIALGCAAGFKLYPAILWLLVLRERDKRESVICVLIVAALILLPFIFTDGTPMMLFDRIIGHTEGRIITDDLDQIGVRNISGLVSLIFLQILNCPEGTVLAINYIVVGTFTALSFIVVLLDREMKFWKVVLLLSCNLVIGFGTPTSYTHIYITLPILFFLISEKKMTKNNLAYLLCFVVTMAFLSGFDYGTYMSLRTAFVMIIAVALIFEGFRSIYHNLRGQNIAKADLPWAEENV